MSHRSLQRLAVRTAVGSSFFPRLAGDTPWLNSLAIEPCSAAVVCPQSVPVKASGDPSPDGMVLWTRLADRWPAAACPET